MTTTGTVQVDGTRIRDHRMRPYRILPLRGLLNLTVTILNVLRTIITRRKIKLKASARPTKCDTRLTGNSWTGDRFVPASRSHCAAVGASRVCLPTVCKKRHKEPQRRSLASLQRKMVSLPSRLDKYPNVQHLLSQTVRWSALSTEI